MIERHERLPLPSGCWRLRPPSAYRIRGDWFAVRGRGQYLERQRGQSTRYLYESHRCQPYSTRRIRQIVKQYATAAGIVKRVYPHVFRHQLITYLTKQASSVRNSSCSAVIPRSKVSRSIASWHSQMSRTNMKRPCEPFRSDKQLIRSYRSFPPVGPTMAPKLRNLSVRSILTCTIRLQS